MSSFYNSAILIANYSINLLTALIVESLFNTLLLLFIHSNRYLVAYINYDGASIKIYYLGK